MQHNDEYEIIRYQKLRHVHASIVEIRYRNSHVHREMEIGVVLGGEARLTFEKGAIDVRRGSLYFCNSNEAHDIFALNRGTVKIAYMQISNNFIADYLSLFRTFECLENDLTGCLSPEQNQALTARFLESLRAYSGESQQSQLLCLSHICRLFAGILEWVPYQLYDESAYQSRKRKMSRLRRVTDYIDEHFNDKISLASLAEAESVTTTYLSHFIRTQLNMTFQDYVNNMRLERAIQIMATSNMPLTDVSMECGFSDIKYLNKMFARHFNCTPAEYRASVQPPQDAPLAPSEGQKYSDLIVGNPWFDAFVEDFTSGKVFPTA